MGSEVMERLQILSEPANTKRVLANLSLAIDEARLVRKIVELSDYMRRIKFQPDSSKRLEYLSKEIERLEEQLAKTRLLAKAS